MSACSVWISMSNPSTMKVPRMFHLWVTFQDSKIPRIHGTFWPGEPKVIGELPNRGTQGSRLRWGNGYPLFFLSGGGSRCWHRTTTTYLQLCCTDLWFCTIFKVLLWVLYQNKKNCKQSWKKSSGWDLFVISIQQQQENNLLFTSWYYW